MIIGRIACSLGKHSIDANRIGHIHGQQVGRCRRCATPLENQSGNIWVPQQVHDAGLGPRAARW